MSAVSEHDRERDEQRLYWAWHEAAAKARVSNSATDKEYARKAWADFQEAYAPVRAQRTERVA